MGASNRHDLLKPRPPKPFRIPSTPNNPQQPPKLQAPKNVPSSPPPKKKTTPTSQHELRVGGGAVAAALGLAQLRGAWGLGDAGGAAAGAEACGALWRGGGLGLGLGTRGWGVGWEGGGSGGGVRGKHRWLVAHLRAGSFLGHQQSGTPVHALREALAKHAALIRALRFVVGVSFFRDPPLGGFPFGFPLKSHKKGFWLQTKVPGLAEAIGLLRGVHSHAQLGLGLRRVAGRRAAGGLQPVGGALVWGAFLLNHVQLPSGPLEQVQQKTTFCTGT